MKKLLFLLLFLNVTVSAEALWHFMFPPCEGNANLIFKASSSVVIAGMASGGISVSTDNGKTWSLTSLYNWSVYLQFTSFCTNGSGEILAGTTDQGVLKGSANGLTWSKTTCQGNYVVKTDDRTIFALSSNTSTLALSKSTNGGSAWTAVPLRWSATPYGLPSLTSFNKTLYIEIGDSIFTSTDLGSTWNIYGTDLPSKPTIYSITPVSEDVLFAATNAGVYYTSDKGKSWSLRNSGIQLQTTGIYGVIYTSNGIFAYGASGLYFSPDMGQNWSFYYKSQYQRGVLSAIWTGSYILAATDQGIIKVLPDKWISYSAVERNQYMFFSNGFTQGKIGYIKTAPNGDIICTSNNSLFRSTDGGSEWIYIEPVKSSSAWGDVLIKDSLYFLQSRDGYFYYSTDYGFTWTKTGSSSITANSMAFSRKTNYIYASFPGLSLTNPAGIGKDNSAGSPEPDKVSAMTPGLYYSSDFGSSWNKCSIAEGLSALFVAAVPGDSIFAAVKKFDVYSGVYMTADNGKSWKEVNEGLPGKSASLMLTDNKNNLLAANGSGIFKFNMKELKWIQFAGREMSDPEKIKFNRYNSPVVLKGGNFYGSTSGRKWEKLSPIDGVTDFTCGKDGYFYEVFTPNMFKSVDPFILERAPENCSLVSPSSEAQTADNNVKLCWQGAEPMAYKYMVSISEDSAFTAPKDSMVMDTSLTLGNLSPNKKYFWKVKAYNEFAAGGFSSVWSFTTGTVSVSETEGEKILSYSLKQNYPNPFNPVTTISYSIPAPDKVQLKIYDILGNEIAVLVDRMESAGEHKAAFNASALPSGVYFCRIISGSYTEIRKMILLK